MNKKDYTAELDKAQEKSDLWSNLIETLLPENLDELAKNNSALIRKFEIKDSISLLLTSGTLRFLHNELSWFVQSHNGLQTENGNNPLVIMHKSLLSDLIII